MISEEKHKRWARLRLHYNFWMTTEDGQIAINEARLELLIAIDAYGTLREAAKILNISYRKAWGDLKETEKFLGLTLLESNRGGKAGGATTLSTDGKILVQAYKALSGEFQDAVTDVVKKFKNTLKEN